MTIILDNITKSYSGRNVINKFRAEIEWGKCYAFVGPSGCGKSTLLKIFMGTEQPDEGAVTRMGDYKYPTLHSAYISQEGDLNLRKNAIWNVKKAHRFGSRTGAIEGLSRFMTSDRIELPVSELTDLERRYVELVRMSFVTADFLVLDEPFRGMDEKQRKEAIDFVLDVRGSRPLLIASQDETDLDFARVFHLG